MPLDLLTTPLSAGKHLPDSGKACVMELVSHLAGEPWSDHPACVSPMIADFLRTWNDMMEDADRQQLRQLVPLVIGTRTTRADDDIRHWMVVDWLVREYTPAWLDLAGFTGLANNLRTLPAIAGHTGMVVAAKPLRAGQDAVWQAARDRAATRPPSEWQEYYRESRKVAWLLGQYAAWTAAWRSAKQTVFAVVHPFDLDRTHPLAETWEIAAVLATTPGRAVVTALQQSAVDLVKHMAAVGRA